MFKLFKKGLKNVLGKFSKKVEEEAPEEKVEAEEVVETPEIVEEKVVEEPVEEKVEPEKEPEKPAEAEAEEKPGKEQVVEEQEKKPEPVEKKPEKPVEKKPEKVVEKAVEKKPVEEKIVEEGVEKKPAEIEEKPEHVEEKKGFFSRLTKSITTKKISESKFDELFWDLEVLLLENNVALEVIEKIRDDLKESLVGKPVPRSKVEETVASSLHQSIEDLFMIPKIDLLEKIKSKKPYVICFVGVNGSGKTTSIAKVAKYLQNHGLSIVLAAADTFRAAAIDQLQVHADNLGVKLIKHDYGSDPAAVAFDAIRHAQSMNKDIVLIDTAGRLHSDVNLMEEMKKIVRVAKPDLKLFVGESITGNDCIEQAKKFDEAVGIDGIILSKADIDEKGGAALSVSYVTKKPIVFLGMGQEYEDLEPFDKEKMIASIGL